MPQFLKVSWLFEDVATLLEHGFELALHPPAVSSNKRDWITSSTLALDRDSGGKKRPWILEKSCFFDLLISPKDSVHVFLRCDHDPRSTTADCPQLLSDRLEIEHQVRIAPNKLADFVDQEHDSLLRPLGVQILLDPPAEVLN